MFDLKQRLALVTGAGRGIGRAIAISLAKAGARVAISARTTSELDEVVGIIRKAGGQAHAFAADLALPTTPVQLIGDIRKQLGDVEILVNNAGIGSASDPRAMVDFRDDFWELTLAINLTAPYKLCKEVMQPMMKKHWGRIINVASINGKVPSLHGAAYTASKHGLLGLTKVLALELAKEGVTVNAICPGPVHTAMNDTRLQYDAKRRGITFEEQVASMTPIGGRLEPEDIAPMAVYLASDESRMITGQSYNIDGGVVMAG